MINNMITLNVFDNLGEKFLEIAALLTSISGPIAGVVLILGGMMFFGDNKLADNAKVVIKRVAAGLVLVLMAPSIINWAVLFFGK